MNRLRKALAHEFDIDGTDAIAIVILSVLALIAGVLIITYSIDESGDGPVRASIACQWSIHPRLLTHGVWLPGFTYLAGLCLMLIRNTLYVPRLYNLFVSTITIAPFYGMVRKLYGPSEARLATVAFVALPLRMGLGASSLTEPTFLFFGIAGLLCLMVAVEFVHGRMLLIWMALAMLIFAEMTRYEIWPLIPLLCTYVYVRTRRLALTCWVAAALLLFPFAWSLENYEYYGDFFHGIAAAEHPLEGGQAMGVVSAMAFLAKLAHRQLGWFLLLTAIAGIVCEFYFAFDRGVRSWIATDRGAYLVLVLAVWGMIFDGTFSRGPAMYDRYLLLGFTLALPPAAMAFTSGFGRSPLAVALGAVVITASIGMTCRLNHPRIFVTRKKPTDIIALARWLRTGPYRNDTILLTRLKWQATYLELYAPEFVDRESIVSVWIPENSTRRFIENKHPTLLITEPADKDGRARIEKTIGRSLAPLMHDPVYTVGPIEVYDISKLSKLPVKAP